MEVAVHCVEVVVQCVEVEVNCVVVVVVHYMELVVQSGGDSSVWWKQLSTYWTIR